MRARRVVGGALLAIVAAALPAAAPVAPDRIDTHVAREMKRVGIPGLSLAVVHHGRIVRSGGYGTANLELHVAATPRTVYEIGSISKQFAAEAVMLLVEDGRVFLDERARHYLPELPEQWAAITARHLLTHTSGLHDWEAAGGFSYTVDHSPADFISFVAKYPLDFAPGTAFAYTNSGFPVLGLIVERVSGRPFTTFVAERVFAAAGMSSARYKRNGDIVPDRADGYVMQDGALRRGQPLRPQVIAANGGVMSNVVDLANWLAAFFSGRIVKPATVAAMLEPVRLANGETASHGFGWFMDAFNGHRLVIHPGTTIGGYSAVVYWLPADELGVVVAANFDDGAFGADGIARFIGNEYVPGSEYAGLSARPDNDPGLTAALATMLRDLAAGKDPALLAPSWRARLTPEGRARIGQQVPAAARLLFLCEEARTPYHIATTNAVQRIRRYRVERTDRDVYASFFITKDGAVDRFYVVDRERRP